MACTCDVQCFHLKDKTKKKYPPHPKEYTFTQTKFVINEHVFGIPPRLTEEIIQN